MQDFLINLFGTEYYRYVIIGFAGLVEVFITVISFMFNAKKKSYFWLKLFLIILSLPLLTLPYSGLLYVDRNLNQIYRVIINTPFNLIFIFAIMQILYINKKDMFLLDYISVLSVALISGAFYSLLINLSGEDSLNSFSIFGITNQYACWALYWVIHIAIDLLLGFLSKNRTEAEFSKRTKTIIYVVSAIVILVYILGVSLITRFDAIAMGLAIYAKVLLIAFSSIALVIRSGILYTSKKEKEIIIINQSLKDNQKQFENLRDSIDIINAKTHDLRHQLSKLGDKIANEDLQTLKEATRIYDSTIKTGNQSLDAIIYQTQLLAQKKNVQLSIMADGKLLNFMEDSELYFLLSNIFNNAFEALDTVTSTEKKIITFKVYSNLGMIAIEESNYYEGGIVLENELPKGSSKKDNSMIHGYGMKSIKYLVEKHNGFISCKADNGIYRLLITFQDK